MRGQKPRPKDVRRGLEAYLRLGSYAAAEAETHIADATLHDWFNDPENGELLGELRSEQTRARAEHVQRLASKAWRVAEKAIDRMEGIVETGKDESAVAAARGVVDAARTLDQAARLDAGTPTDIRKTTSELTDEQVVEEVNRLLKRAPVS